MGNTHNFVEWFRNTAPYIKGHRNKTFVILVSDEVIYSDPFGGLVNDIALLNHLGIKLVILHGSRHSIDRSLADQNIESRFHDNTRISDAETFPHIIHAINEVRTFFESQLSQGLPNTPMSGSEISIVSGNFVTGMPIGVVDGVDMQLSGRVRDVKASKIKQLLSENNVVLLSNLGYSLTGEVFNLPAEELASEAAQALDADKLIFIHHNSGEQLNVDTLSTQECSLYIEKPDCPDEVKNLLTQSIKAIEGNVKRVHLIDQNHDGGLLLELFTRDGSGTMITDLFYEGLRPAEAADVGGIKQIIEPLEASGALVSRTREQLELDIEHFSVIEKDGMVIACIACIPDQSSGSAEIACLAVHQNYRNAGFGRKMLAMAERLAKKRQLNRLFTLTTRTSHWFLESGFISATADDLPQAKRASYNESRRSKIFVKLL